MNLDTVVTPQKTVKALSKQKRPNICCDAPFSLVFSLQQAADANSKKKDMQKPSIIT